MEQISMIGYGVVGHGVAELLERNAAVVEKHAGKPVRLKRILTARERTGDPRQELLTLDENSIFGDAEVSIVVECISDLDASYRYCKQALTAGKHYVTSNKNLIATHGVELTALASRNGAALLFEASVAAGIPVLRPIYKCLSANHIDGLMGIVNGTTNYILTRMKREGCSFAEALQGAQSLGYAEANPAADVEGFDACRKLAILLSVAFGRFVPYARIPTEGITAVTRADIALAERLGHSIKLIVKGRLTPDGVYARVSPLLLPHGHILAAVEDVFNAVDVSADMAGEVLFYGRGAGAYPSASSIIGDVIDIVTHGRRNDPVWSEDPQPLLTLDDEPCALFIRVPASERPRLFHLWPDGAAAEEDGKEGSELGFITPRASEKSLRDVLRSVGITPAAVLRVL